MKCLDYHFWGWGAITVNASNDSHHHNPVIRRPLGLSKGCPACGDIGVLPPPCFPPPLTPKPSSLRRVVAPAWLRHGSGTAGPTDFAVYFLSFESLSSFKPLSEALWNQFGSDLGPILGPFWELKSAIKASLIAFEVVYTRSPFLNDIISVLNGFCFRGGLEIQ